MIKRTQNVLLLLNGMINTRVIQLNKSKSDINIYDEESEYPWDSFFFESYARVVEELNE